MPAKVNKEKCTGCQSCIDSCPVEAITIEDGIACVNQNECLDCGSCVGVCPIEAIELDD